ncbi:kinesin-4, putative [Plasmodium chabaudi chabaudi]|uniref:Kinesin-4, putative n=1 Tax=Plasmodium chabaudi chabaudi TaxID=31271 RepID=A0A4V0KAE0_PLACU|nr:kinesin-4, putative [Plasmodium chabaudi chabaudi]VTZ69560.1 kinesin-4, putative [Plasmodium chabaudi chabaudi]|eukprot:XP_016654184.1 conserved Plasmodium protein, unknown function [Plasmodium chabaudi chabaudi]
MSEYLGDKDTNGNYEQNSQQTKKGDQSIFDIEPDKHEDLNFNGFLKGVNQVVENDPLLVNNNNNNNKIGIPNNEDVMQNKKRESENLHTLLSTEKDFESIFDNYSSSNDETNELNKINQYKNDDEICDVSDNNEEILSDQNNRDGEEETTFDKNNCQVVVRIRPKKKENKLCDDLTKNVNCNDVKNIKYNNNCICINNQKFLFDKVFKQEAQQEDVYSYLSDNFLDNLFDGYNCTIFAYGQTGSGKTYTMGFDYINKVTEHVGILPRFLNDIFNMIEKKQKTNNITFDTSCTYIEIYNEEIIDLIDSSEEDYDDKIGNRCNVSAINTVTNNKDLKINNKKKKKKREINKNISIREDINKKEIILMGVKTAKVSNVEDSFAILHKGNLLRTTERTFMNDKSSRSHAIFTINLIQRKNVTMENGPPNEVNTSADIENAKNIKTGNQKINNDINDSTNAPLNERIMTTSESNNGNKIEESEKKEEIICSKLHFVDLAGSERAKRTETKGNRLKEAININYGLLSLSNVIYGLSSKKKVQHIPYRNSKLTRILQDSLGGNSKTVMIACISVEPSDFYETFSTVKYAARTKKIKNNPIINYDMNNLIINDLRKQLFNLNLELKKYKVECKDKYNFNDDKKLKELSDQNCKLLKKIKNLNIKRKKLICLIFYYISLIRKNDYQPNSTTCLVKEAECCTSPKSANIEESKNDNPFNLNSIENSKIVCQDNYLDSTSCKKEDNNAVDHKNNQAELECVNGSAIKRVVSSTDDGAEKNEKGEVPIKLDKICGMCEKINIIENEETNDFDFSFLENKHLFLNLEKDKKCVEDIFRQYELNKFNEKKLNDLNKKYINIFEKNKGYEKKINELNKIIKKMKKGSKVKLNEKYNKAKGRKSAKGPESKIDYNFLFSKKNNDKKKVAKKKIKKSYNSSRHNIGEDVEKSVDSLNKLKSVYNLFCSDKIRKGYYSEIELEREVKNKIQRKKSEKEKRKCYTDTDISSSTKKNTTFVEYIMNYLSGNQNEKDWCFQVLREYKKRRRMLSKMDNKNCLEENDQDLVFSDLFFSSNNIYSDLLGPSEKFKKIFEKKNETNFNENYDYYDKNESQNNEDQIFGKFDSKFSKGHIEESLQQFKNCQTKMKEEQFSSSENDEDSEDESCRSMSSNSSGNSNVSPNFLKSKLNKLQKIIKQDICKIKQVNKEKKEYNTKNEILTNSIVDLKKKLQYLQINSNNNNKNCKNIESMKQNLTKITKEKEKIQKKLNENEQQIKHLKVDIMKMKNNFLKTSTLLKEEQKKHNNIIQKKENLITKLHEREEIYINKLKKKEEISKQAYSKLLKRNKELLDQLKQLKKKQNIHDKVEKNENKNVNLIQNAMNNNKAKLKKKEQAIEEKTDNLIDQSNLVSEINVDNISSIMIDEKVENEINMDTDVEYDTESDKNNLDPSGEWEISTINSILSDCVNSSCKNSDVSVLIKKRNSSLTQSINKIKDEEYVLQNILKNDIKKNKFLKDFLKKKNIKKKISPIKTKLEKEKFMNKNVAKILQALYVKRQNEGEDNEKNEIVDNQNEESINLVLDTKEKNKDTEKLLTNKFYEEKIDEDVLYYEEKLKESNENIKNLKRSLIKKKEEMMLQKVVKDLLKKLYSNYKKRKENEKKVNSLKKFIYSENLFISKIYNNFVFTNDLLLNNSTMPPPDQLLKKNNYFSQFYSKKLTNIENIKYDNNFKNPQSCEILKQGKNLLNSSFCEGTENITHFNPNNTSYLYKTNNLDNELLENPISKFKRRNTYSLYKEVCENSEPNNEINLKKRNNKSRLMENIYLGHCNKKRMILSSLTNPNIPNENNQKCLNNLHDTDKLNMEENNNHFVDPISDCIAYENDDNAQVELSDKQTINLINKKVDPKQSENFINYCENNIEGRQKLVEKNNYPGLKVLFDMPLNSYIKRKSIDNCYILYSGRNEEKDESCNEIMNNLGTQNLSQPISPSNEKEDTTYCEGANKESISLVENGDINKIKKNINKICTMVPKKCKNNGNNKNICKEVEKKEDNNLGKENVTKDGTETINAKLTSNNDKVKNSLTIDGKDKKTKSRSINLKTKIRKIEINNSMPPKEQTIDEEKKRTSNNKHEKNNKNLMINSGGNNLCNLTKGIGQTIDKNKGNEMNNGNCTDVEVERNNSFNCEIDKEYLKQMEKIHEESINTFKNKIKDITIKVDTLRDITNAEGPFSGNNISIHNRGNNISYDNYNYYENLNTCGDSYTNLTSEKSYKNICIKNCHKYGVTGLCVKETNNNTLQFFSSSLNSIKLWDNKKEIWNYEHVNIKNEKSTFINSLIVSFQNNCFFAGINSYVHLFDIRTSPKILQKYYYSDKNDGSLLISLLNDRSNYIPLILHNGNYNGSPNDPMVLSNQNGLMDEPGVLSSSFPTEGSQKGSEYENIKNNQTNNLNENEAYDGQHNNKENCENGNIEDQNSKDKLKTIKEVDSFQSEYCICACGNENFIKVFDIRKNGDNMWLAKIPVTNKIEYITHIPMKKNTKNNFKNTNILKNIIIASRDKTVKIWKKGWVSFYPPSYDWCTSLSYFPLTDLIQNKNPSYNINENFDENKNIFSNYDSLVISGSRDSHLRFWLYSTDGTSNEFNRFMKIIKNAHKVDITCVSKYQGNSFITTDRDGFIQMWDCNILFKETDKFLVGMDLHNTYMNLMVNKIGKMFRHSTSPINKIAYHENTFLTASNDGSIKIFYEK